MAVERMCAVCRTRRKKSELIKITRSSDGNISTDEKGRLPGRGMYICKDGDCVNFARKRRVIERSFNVGSAAVADVYDRIESL